MTRMLNLIPRTGVFTPRRDLFDSFFEDWNAPSLFSEEKTWMPAFDIAENEKEYIVTAEMPGIVSKDLDVTYTDGILSIKGEKKQETEEKEKDYHRVERRFGTFNRSFRIPGKVKTDKVDANFKDGILTLTLPKSEEDQVKKIEVK